MGYIPKTTKQPVKVFMGLSAVRLALGVITVFFVEMILTEITSSVLIQLSVSGLSLVLYLILSGRSPSNPDKIFALGMIDYFIFLLTPKKLYGNRTTECERYREREEQKNAKKEQRKKPKGKVRNERNEETEE